MLGLKNNECMYSIQYECNSALKEYKVFNFFVGQLHDMNICISLNATKHYIKLLYKPRILTRGLSLGLDSILLLYHLSR